MGPVAAPFRADVVLLLLQAMDVCSSTQMQQVATGWDRYVDM
jgi:hypothetical protein